RSARWPRPSPSRDASRRPSPSSTKSLRAPMARLHVAHVLPVYGESGVNLLGGGERYALNLATHLGRECDVTLFTFGPRRAGATVVLGGIDLERYPLSAAPRQARAVLVARILPHKGANHLVEAAGPGLPVVIAGRVGDPAYYERLRKLAEGKPVTFVIDPTDEQVRELYATSAVTVSASVYTDLNGGSWPMS